MKKHKSIIFLILAVIMACMSMPVMVYAVSDAVFKSYKASGGEKYTVEKDADCEHGSYLRVSYKLDNNTTSVVFEDNDVERAISEGCIQKSGGNYYDTKTKAGVPYTPALGHSVTTGTVAPTCGSKGYTYDLCSRCNKVVLPKGAKDTDRLYVSAVRGQADVYNVKKPIKYEGAPCNYEYGVVREATPYMEGINALICTECRGIKEGSEVYIPKTDPADPVIAYDELIDAADRLINNPSKYTASSIQAIIEAKADLNAAVDKGSQSEISMAAEVLKKAIDNVKRKKSNPMTVKVKTVKAKAGKKTTVKAKKVFTVKNAKGTVSYKKTSGNKKILVSYSGLVIVYKGLKKGKTYKVKVKVTAAGNGDYLPKTVKRTLKIKIK